MADDWWSNDPMAPSGAVATSKGSFWDNDPKADTTENQGVLEKIKGALQYGLSQDASGISNTLKQTGASPAAQGALDTVARDTSPTSSYTPASVGLHDSSKGLLDRAGYIPRALLESLPAGAQDVASGALGGMAGGAVDGALGGPVGSGIGALVGGALGGVGSYGLRNYGNDVQSAAQASGNAVPSTMDKVRAGASSVVGGLLSRLGFLGAAGKPVTEVGADAIAPVLAQVGKGATADAATNAAQTVQHDALVDQKLPSANDVLTDAATGAVSGAGIRTGMGAKDLTQAVKFADIDPQFGGRVADRFSGLDTDTPSKAYDALQTVQAGLDNEIKNHASDVAPHIKDIEEQSGYNDDTQLKLDGVRAQLKAGQTVDPQDISDLKNTLGGYREGASLVNSLEDQNSLNGIKQFGVEDKAAKTFAGGISSTALAKKFLTPWNHPGHAMSEAVGVGAGTHWLTGLDPHTSATIGIGVPITQGILGGAARGLDSFLGNRNPIDEFTQRFQPVAPADTSALPSFRAQQLAQKLAAQNATGAQGGGATAPAPVAPAPAPPTAPQAAPQAPQAPAPVVAPQPMAPAIAQAAQATAIAPVIQMARAHAKAQASAAASNANFTGQDTLSTSVGNHTVTRAAEGVKRPAHYMSSINDRMKTREGVITKVHHAMEGEVHPAIEQLHHELNQNGMTQAKAKAAIEFAVSQIPEEQQPLVKHTLETPAMIATFPR